MLTAHETSGSVRRRVRRDDGRRRAGCRALAVAAGGAAEAPARGAATVVAGGGDTRPRRSVSRHHGQRPGRAWPVQRHVDGGIDGAGPRRCRGLSRLPHRATARENAQAGERRRVAEVDEPELLRPGRASASWRCRRAARGRLRAAARRAERTRAEADARHHAPQRNARPSSTTATSTSWANGATTVMGTPSATEPWGWQFDGHHAVINYFVLGDQVVMSPHFAGSEPVIATLETARARR